MSAGRSKKPALFLKESTVEAEVGIELDGSQHGHPEHLQADAERDAWLAERGIQVMRFWNARLRREKQVVRDAIWQALQERVPQPVPEYCRAGVVGVQAVEVKKPLG